MPTFEIIYNEFFNNLNLKQKVNNISKNKIKNFFTNWEILILNSEGKEINKYKLKKVIDYIYTSEKNVFYLTAVKWYILNETFDKYIKK